MSPSRSAGKGRGFGCGTLAILVLIAFSIPAVRMGQVVWKAKQAEQILNDALGEATTFVPSTDGAIPPQRIESFLRVRAQVFDFCVEFQGRLDQQLRLEEFENDPDISGPETLRQGFGGLREILGGGPAFLRLMNVRNKALLAEEMGLGEYMYIYVLAYHEQLQLEGTSKFAKFQESYVGERARRELSQILQNQIERLETEPTGTEREALVEALRDQVDALVGDDRSLPWMTGLPLQIAASFRPYATSLDGLYCSGLAKFELSQKNKGLDIQN